MTGVVSPVTSRRFPWAAPLMHSSAGRMVDDSGKEAQDSLLETGKEDGVEEATNPEVSVGDEERDRLATSWLLPPSSSSSDW